MEWEEKKREGPSGGKIQKGIKWKENKRENYTKEWKECKRIKNEMEAESEERKEEDLELKWDEIRDTINEAAKMADMTDRQQMIKKWIDQKQRLVAESKNATEWWKNMDWFRKGEKQIKNNIGKEEWLEHFKTLLECQDTLSDEEIEQALRKLKAGKAAGEDGISSEFLKNLPTEGQQEIYELIKDIWSKKSLIESWRGATIYTIFKKGDKNKTGNYRGISLLNVGYKVLASIMARRLSAWFEVNKKLSEAQGGFRRNRGTIEHIFVLNTLIGNKF